MFCVCVVTKLLRVLFKSLYVVHLCCLKVSVGSVYMFACFTFVLSQTHNMFCSIVCISYICVVTNVLCVLLKYLLVLQLCPHNRLVDPVLIKHLYVLHLCRHKRTLCSVEMFSHFAFVSSQSYRGFCLNVSIFCLVFVLSQTYLGFCLNVCVFYICVVTNLTCVLFHCFYNFV